ncbi:MAG: 3-hydroxyacyl-CoA dehydrogenase/enoyl-CoA hydratase family protein, partial [Candidatus Hydrogenedentes bacterium]|nr:3-hydroxyacyl-CoA dehydrogenase/enoyl-CoA hydratase family protein [Candidatus Hydrogenedentota bacterium]
VDGAKKALLKAKPSPIYTKSVLGLIETGNFDDDMAKIAGCDWIIEVVKEDLKIKKLVYANIAKHRAAGSIVTSNTSGIPIKAMATDMTEEMSAHFLGTHFFNPPRYMKLLEIIPSPNTKPEVIETMAAFCENVLGKGIVYAKDTPNFVANRLLTFAMQYIMHEMKKDGLSVEEVDALTGPAIGHASSATFRTADLVGLDTLNLVVGNVRNGCPDDERVDLMSGPDWFDKMVEKGLLGNKSGSGFYKKTKDRDEKGKRIILGLDLDTLEYRAPIKARFDCTGAVRNVEGIEDKLKIMNLGEDKGAQFVFKQFANLAQYAGNRIPEIADDIVNIDNATKWGFAWEVGIFETWDILGFDTVCEKMAAIGVELPAIATALKEAGFSSFYRVENGVEEYFDPASKSYKAVPTNPREIKLANIKTDSTKLVATNDSASLIDMGDGIVCCEFHCKMNVIDPDLTGMLNQGVDLLEAGKFDGMIIANQGPHFCAGANIFLILGEIMQKNWDGVEGAIRGLQGTCMRMKYCNAPVVAAPHHYTFGGGVELCQHADKVVLAGECYAGLVEMGVGLLPAGGGTKEMHVRAMEYCAPNVEVDSFPFIRRAFEAIGQAKVGTSGAEVIELGYYRSSDIVLPNYEHQISKAKAVCLGMVVAGYTPPVPPQLKALGDGPAAAFKTAVWGMQQNGWASEHDVLIASKVINVLVGGDRLAGTPITEQDLLDLECEGFLSLCGTEKTVERIQHMLMNNKPLRN